MSDPRTSESPHGSAPRLGRDFRLYAVAMAVSTIGDRVAIIALVFLVIRLSHAYAPALALFYIVRILPRLLAGLAAGVMVDHVNRQRLMVICDLGRAVLLAVVPIFGVFQLWTLYPVVFVLYALTLLFDTAVRAALPDVVPEERMMRANSLLTVIDTSADIAYAVGGTLVYELGLRIPFFIDAGTFAFSALMVSQMRVPMKVSGIPLGDLSDIMTRIREGVVFLITHAFLRWTAVTFFLTSLAVGIAFVVSPLWANAALAKSSGLIGPLHSGAFRFSILEVALGGGALLGSIVVSRLPRTWPRGRVLGSGIVGIGVAYGLLAFVHNFYVAAVLMALGGLANSTFLIIDITLLQLLTPSVVRGRVLAARGTFTTSAVALGSAVAAPMLIVLPFRGVWLAVGGLFLVSSLCIWLRPHVRNQP